MYKCVHTYITPEFVMQMQTYAHITYIHTCIHACMRRYSTLHTKPNSRWYGEAQKRAIVTQRQNCVCVDFPQIIIILPNPGVSCMCVCVMHVCVWLACVCVWYACVLLCVANHIWQNYVGRDFPQIVVELPNPGVVCMFVCVYVCVWQIMYDKIVFA